MIKYLRAALSARTSIALSAAIAVLCSSSLAVAADELVFNFRANSSSASWTTGHSTKNGATETCIATASGAAKTSGARYQTCGARLDGTNDYVQMNDEADADTNDGLTLQAWFNADTVGGNRTIFSNTQYSGFALRLEGDRLAGLVNIAGTYRKVTSWQPIEPGRDYNATFIVDFMGPSFEGSNSQSSTDSVRLILLVDGQFAGYGVWQTDASSRIINSPFEPLIGAEPGDAGQAWGWFFDGTINAVTVRNYPIEYESFDSPQERFFSAGSPHDTTTHNGQPSYWDHSWSQTLDEKLPQVGSSELANLSQMTMHGIVPFLNDEYVVQGVAHSCEGEQSCADERVYLSLYWMDTAGHSGSAYGNRSLIAELDPKDGYRVTRCWKLKGNLAYSHVGGLAYHDGYAYVSSSYKVARYNVSGAMPNSQLSSCDYLSDSGTWEVKASSSISSTSVGGTRFMLTGNYCVREDDCSNLSGSGKKPYAYLYYLDANGALEEEFSLKYRLPYKAQGAELRYTEGDGWLLHVSTSNGNSPAYLRQYRLSDVYCPYGESCDLGPEIPGSRMTLPRGVEDLAIVGSDIWTASESGSRYFQRTSDGAWSQFFPFVYSMRIE